MMANWNFNYIYDMPPNEGSFSYDTVSSHLSADSSLSIGNDSIYSDSFSTATSCNKSLNNARFVDNNNCQLETNVTCTEKLNSYVSFSSSNESPEINNQNNAYPNIQVDDNFAVMRNNDTHLENVVEYDINTSAINKKAESNNCSESNVLEYFIDIRKKNLYEDSEEQSFVYEENKVLDWSIEVEDNAESNNCIESNVLEDFIDTRKNNLYEDSEEQSFVYEENKVLDWSIEVEDNAESNNCIESSVLEDFIDIGKNNLYEDSEEQSFVYEENKVLDWSIEVEDDAESNNCNESNVLEDFIDTRKNNLYEDSEEQSFVYEENKVLDWSIEVEDNAESNNCIESSVLEGFIDIGKNNLYEDSEEQSFVYEENKVLDWSIEVEDNDIKEEDDDTFKLNFSTSDDIEPYYSTEVIKYLKENLYLYALSGHMSLKESIPVVDILPTIDEEPESVEEDYSLKQAVANLELKEETIQSVIEKNEVADPSIDRSPPFRECQDLEYTVEDSEQVTKNNSDLVENNLSYVPAVYTFQQNRSNSEYHATQSDEKVNNDDKLPTKDTKLISFNAECRSLASGEELQISVENLLNHVETGNVFKSTLKLPQMHNHEKEYQSKLQNNCIKIEEEIGATQKKSLCPEIDAQLKPNEELEIRKEVILNQFDSNRTTNTTCHVPEEIEAHVECYSERNVEKVVEVDEKVCSKAKKKKFHALRKWLGNLCCCARKKT